MNIQEFRAGLDLLFELNRIDEVEPFLEGALKTAISESDDNAVVHVLNEMIGFYRETCDYDRSVMYGEKALEIIASAGEKDSLTYATTELNLANALRAAGRLDESIAYYTDTERLYRSILKEDAFDHASLYNNMSLVYQEARMFPEAIDCLNRAMEIVLLYPDKRFELAVTHANLGNSLLGALSADPSIEKGHPDIYEGIRTHLTDAVNIFIERNENGAHLGAALMGLGDLNALQGLDEEAVIYYLQAMDAVDRNLGHIEYYYRARAGYEAALNRLRKNENTARIPDMALNGMEICRLYYDEVIKPLIEKEYPGLSGKVSVGLFGEGSDAYGFDDIESRDHDWGPGVILLINNRSDYDRFGQKLNSELLQKAAETAKYRGFKPDADSIRKGRRGVFCTEDYYTALLGKKMAQYLFSDAELSPADGTGACVKACADTDAGAGAVPDRRADVSGDDICDIWLSVPEYALAAAVNGEVWDDESRTIARIREKLIAYYPERLWRSMLKQNMALYSQNARYNYLRMKRRGENASADMLLSEGMKNAARIAYILNGKYAPHDKWLFKGLCDIDKGVYSRIEKITELARKAPVSEPVDAAMRPVMNAIDDLSLYLQEQMRSKGLILHPETYMEDALGQIDAEVCEGKGPDMSKEELVKRVVKDEWEAFDKVINEGGRADCQDNWGTFNIMRSSQYLTWNEDMLLKYAEDFEASVASGWNPVTEKYGRMEESTAPEKYALIADSLPPVSEEKRAIIEEIVSIQVGWMEDFAADYPKMAGNARTIHTSDDTPYDTSYETYLRGELMTYSDEMLAMYGAFIVGLAREGKNLAYMTMSNTAMLYGYKSIDDAEKSL